MTNPKLTNLQYILLSLAAAFLLWLAWPPSVMTFVIFFAFVPLLFLTDFISFDNHRKPSGTYFLFTYLSFFIWNLATTYWIKNATLVGAIAAIVFNALLMTLPFFIFHFINVKSKRKQSWFFLVAFWMSFEYIHFNWDLSWPWLTLGNAFAIHTDWIQWYEFTGTPGGTFWILLVNILIYKLISTRIVKRQKKLVLLKQLAVIIIVLILPLIISYFLKPRVIESSMVNAVIVQPNIDPYNEKFDYESVGSQLDKLIELSEKGIDSNTILLLWPETAISMPVDEGNLLLDEKIRRIVEFLEKYPRLTLVSGMDSYRFYGKGKRPTETARFYRFDSTWYDAFNAALCINSKRDYQIYHKSRLVPGVEKMPYPKLFSFMEKFAIDLGGTSGSLGRQKEASVFQINDSITVAPVICYESVYGDYLGDFIIKGANVIAVLTNDGWWGNTAGHKQHYLYAALRAVEFRKCILRSANTGVSCFIDPSGTIRIKRKWWTPDYIKAPLIFNNEKTFYAYYGDYLGRIASFASALILLIAIVNLLVKKGNPNIDLEN